MNDAANEILQKYPNEIIELYEEWQARMDKEKLCDVSGLSAPLPTVCHPVRR